MKKRIITTLLVAVLGLSSSITAFAAPKTMPDGNVFDAEYYANTYQDVKEALGTDEAVLYKHYLDYGKKEGRSPIADGQQSLTQSSTVNQISLSSGLTFEESDRNYLIAATIANGGEHVEGEWWSSTYNFVRKDYTADPRYQVLKAWIIDNSNGSDLWISAPFSYYVETTEESTELVNMTKNLAVDLMKEGYCKNIEIDNLPVDGQIRGYVTGRSWYQKCSINMTRAIESVVANHPEIKGYFKE